MNDMHSNDTSRFPDPVYRDTVLRPLFAGVKVHHAGDLRRIDMAHLVMLVETGILTAPQGAAIADGLRAVWQSVDPQALEYSEDVEDFFFLMEKRLKAGIGADLGGRLHTARSRNDIDHTIFRLALKRQLHGFLALGQKVAATLVDVAEREAATLIVAYTHGQPAQPSTFGHYLSAVIEVFLRDLIRLEAALDVVDRSPLGAAAITTSGFSINRHRVAELLGFAAPLRNSYSCIATADYITATYSALQLMFLHLGRPIQDLQFWTSFEVGQVRMPNSFVQISSIMPQKRNPVATEHLRHLASRTVGIAQTMLGIMHNTPFTDMNDSEAETQEFGYQAFETGERVLTLFGAVMDAARIDPNRVATNLRLSCATITELADTLVRDEGLPFREAHEIAAEVARAVVARGAALSTEGYAPFVEAFRTIAGREPGLDEARFSHATSAQHFVAVRERFGGPGPRALADAFDQYRTDLAAIADRNQARDGHEAASKANLEQNFNKLSGGK